MLSRMISSSRSLNFGAFQSTGLEAILRSRGPLDGIADVYDSPAIHPGGDASVAPYGIVNPGPEGLLHPAAGRATRPSLQGESAPTRPVLQRKQI